MNTLLNTILAQITYTRGALIALFAGLFILTACGGGGAVATDVAPDGGTSVDCETNIFDPACGVEKQAEQVEAIRACITAISTGESETCDTNIPMVARNCLNAPFETEGCATALPASVTIASVQATRTTDCRADTVSGAACTGAIVNVCGTVSSTIDGVLFTETLCGDAYNARRSTLVNNCRTGVAAGQDRATACASVVVNTDSAANEKALDCVLDAFAEGCDTNDDVKTVVEKTDDTIKSIDDEKTDRVAFCRGASNFAQNPLCMNAITATCADDPFTQTTGASPENFCNPASRTAFLTRCTDALDNNDQGCATVNVSTGETLVIVDTCVATPYAAGCGDAVFEGLKTARYNHCIGDTPTESCMLVKDTVLCVADGDRANPFHAICRTAGSYTQQQTDYCTTRTELPECATGLITTCADNPFAAICLAVDFYTADRAGHIADCIADAVTNKADCDMVVSGTTSVADCITDPFDVANGCNASPDFLATRTSRTSLCTPSATFFDNLCNNYDGIDTARDGICETEATSFHVGCLGRTDGVALAMRKAFIQTCLATPSDDCNVPTSSLSHTVAQCIINPHREECKDDLDFAEVKLSRTTLCTDTALYFNPLCNTFAEIDATRLARCTEGATSFDMICDGKGYDTDREAGQKAFALICRTAPTTPGCEKPADGGLGASTATIADCSNGRDPYQPQCPIVVGFEDERAARDLECADITTLGTGLCTFAKIRNLCVKDPFGTDGQGADCDPTDYMTARTNRDTHCRVNGITPGDTLCEGRKAYICDGENTDSNPLATLCGADNSLGEQEFCRTNSDTAGACESDAATACQANPFNDNFGAYRFNCKDALYYSSRITACSGEISALPDGATASDCAVAGVADVICADSGPQANPFAKICADLDATMNIPSFNQLMVQENFCGDTRKAGDCTVVYTRLCTGDNLVQARVGAAGFDCLNDPDPIVRGLRNDHCTAPATSFTDGCVDGTHGVKDAVNNARISLAETCRTAQNAEGCDDHANAGDSGPTVADCSANTVVGDPYQTGCVDNPLFTAEHTTRATFCSTGANVINDRLCQSAREFEICIHFPYGNDKQGMACDVDTYMTARINRETHCRNTGESTGLCINIARALCDGVGENDNPFAVDCNSFTEDGNNVAAQNRWCAANSGHFRCDNRHSGACSETPFDTSVTPRSGEPVNCLEDVDNGIEANTYTSQRQLFCATGRELDKDRCDTTEIAPDVCGESKGGNANPFAAFCDAAENDGQDATELLATRQLTLSHCKDTVNDNSGDAVCERTSGVIADLDFACANGATSITAQCAYTQYADTQRAFCADAGSLNIFNAGCKTDGTHGDVTTARKNECAKEGTSILDAGNVFCPTIVEGICRDDAFKQKADTTYLCGTNVDNVNYVTAREMACTVRPADGEPNETNCRTFLGRLCLNNEFGMAGSEDYNCAGDDTFDGARETRCGATGNGDGSLTTECMVTIKRICKGAASITTAANGYDCFNSDIRDVEIARQAHCANPPQGGDTTGCETVIAGLCTGAASFSGSVDTGNATDFYDCAGNTDQLVINERQAHCAIGDNDDMVAGCPAVLDALCTNKLVQTTVPTGVQTGAGMNYNCSTSTVPAVKTARETHCRLAASNTGGLCNGTIASLCSDNPFEKLDEGAFGSLCVDAGASTAYATARKEECRDNGTEGDGQTGGKCATPTLKGAICDGNDVGDSPYAAVCGAGTANLAGQTAFCRLSHLTPVLQCGGTISTVCDVTDGNPFDTLCDTTYHGARATRCRQSELKTGSVDLPMGADCADTIALACAGGQNGVTPITANPFDTLCNEFYDGAREMACRTGDTGSSKCEATITNYCEDGGVAITKNLFDTLCLEGNTYNVQRDTFCTKDMIFNTKCDGDVHGATEDARRTKCLETGTAIGDTESVCPGFVATACEDPFTKQENGTSKIDLCTGMKGNTGKTYEEIRTTACSGEASAWPSNAALCSTPELSGAICGNGLAAGEDGSVVGSNPFAYICSEADGNYYFTGLIESQRNACRASRIADGSNCMTTIEGFCGMPNAPTDSNNLFDSLCNIGYDDARDNACLEQRVTAGANNGNNDNCNKRQSVKDTCEADPFTKAGCATVEGRAGFIIAYCTMGDAEDIFDDDCLEGEQNVATYGEVAKARDDYCGTTTTVDDANCTGARQDKICGVTENSNPFAVLCGSNKDNRITFCELETQRGMGQCADDKDVLCGADPFGTALGLNDNINCRTGDGDYSDTRERLATACRDKQIPANGAKCTKAIDDCNDNPFSQTAFNGGACDALAFAGAFVPHCEKPENAWEDRCNAFVGQGGVMATRTMICTTAATSFTKGCVDGTHGAMGAVDGAQEALALTCVDTPDADGCTDSVNDMGTTVAQCSANPFSTTLGCFDNGIFEKQRVARISLCTVAATSFNELCKNLDVAGTNETRLGDIDIARTNFCKDIAEYGNTDCETEGRRADICDGDETTDKPHATVCGTNNGTNQKAFCRLDNNGNSDADGCEGTVAIICDVGNGNPFDTICGESSHGDRVTLCRDFVTNSVALPGENTTCDSTVTVACEGNILSGGMIPANPFDLVLCGADSYDDEREAACRPDGTLPDGADCTNTIGKFCGVAGSVEVNKLFDPLCTEGDTYNGDRTTYCTMGDTIFDPKCNNFDTNGEVTTARKAECLKTGSSTYPNQTCESIIYGVCITNVFEQKTQTTQGQTTDLCTGMNEASETYHSLRVTACEGEITNLPTGVTASACNDENLSGAICGDADTIGSKPFAKICSDATGNYYYDVLTAAQQNACRNDGNADGLGCATTIMLTCEGGMRGGKDVPANPFDLALCNDSYDTTREALCRPNGMDKDNPGCVATIAKFCVSPVNTDDLFDPLCRDDAGVYETARQDHCLSLALGAEPDNCGAEGDENTVLGKFCKTGQNARHCPLREVEIAAFVDTPDWETGAKQNSDVTNLESTLEVLTILDLVGTDDASDTNYVKADANGVKIDGGVDVSGDKATTGTLMLSEAGTTDAQGSGVAFARIEFPTDTSATKLKYYAGILADTDLGGRLVEPSATGAMRWDAVISIVIGDGAVKKIIDTGLYVNFADKSFKSDSTLAAIDFNTGGSPAQNFYIDGKFTTEGIIYGTTKLGTDASTIVSDGTLTGLIGSKGAVAVFVSDGLDNTGGEYAGGLVADNPDPNFDIDCSLAGGNAFNTSLCLVATRAALCRDRATNSITDANCQTAEIRGVICVAQGDFANLADSICDEDVGNGVDYQAARELAFCTVNGIQDNPFDVLCGENYEDQRQISCNGQPVDAPSGGRIIRPKCEETISKLCLAEPFNRAAGASAMKFDCLAATSDIYVEAREMEIGLCVNGTQTDKQRPICMDSEVEKITTPCGMDPLAPECTLYEEQYMTQRATRLSDCRGDATMRGATLCTNAIPTICTSGDTPFSDLCDNHLDVRKTAVGTCLEDSLPLPAVCNTLVAVGKTVLDCIATPFATECSADFAPANCEDGSLTAECQNPFYAASERICEDAETSFTAGCLDYSNGFVRQPTDSASQTAAARITLIDRCTDGSMDNNTGCDTIIANGVTLMNCIDNPFLTECRSLMTLAECADTTQMITDRDCSGAAIAFALSQSREAVIKRTTFVGMCVLNEDKDSVCATIIAGDKTITDCISTPFDADCSAGDVATAFNNYRAPTCLDPATSFRAACNEETYEGTDNARAEQALGCAIDPTGAGCSSNDFVSGSLTVNMCNADPFATGCENPAFINARLQACKGANPNDACDIEHATARTNYVAGEVAGLRDNSGAVGGNIVKHTSTLNEAFYPNQKTVIIDQAASGFALVYIPEVRNGDIITSQSRYYAGLLSGTDVGAPPHSSFARAEWVGKLTLINKGTLEMADFKLDVDFHARAIGALDRIYSVDYVVTTLGNFYINGKFTTKGIIYGTTSLIDEMEAKSSRGTLTGVIGENGAVGAFISSGAGLDVNTLGEYAGGFVAAPEFNCSTNPLDIRCDSTDDRIAGLQEDACSFSYSKDVRACNPVFERVCIDPENTAKLFLITRDKSTSANVNCGGSPITLALRKTACLMNGEAFDCLGTIDKVCNDNVFDALCDGDGRFTRTRSFTCFNISGSLFTSNNGDIKNATNCETLITRDCEKDPFKGICYTPGTTLNRYNPARVAKCADHNFAANNLICGNKNGLGRIVPDNTFDGKSRNIIADYCVGISGNPAIEDEYEVCNDKTADYLAWRDAGTTTNDGGTSGDTTDDFEVGIVTGYRSASANDVGLIAGDADGLNLGDGATSVHNPETLTLELATNGVAIASATVGGKLQSYGGLLSGANVGAPVQQGDATADWSAQIALLWQDGASPTQTTLLRNTKFSIGLNFSAQDIAFSRTNDIQLVNTAGVDSGTITLGITGTTGQKMLGGTVTLNIDSETHVGNFRGLIGNDGLLGAFASSTRTGDNAFAGGLVAEDSGDCTPDGSGNPFKTSAGCTDAEKRDEVTRCYNDGGALGDCTEISRCFENSGSELFGVRSFIPNGGQGTPCTNPVLDGARAIYCLDDNTSDANCTNLLAGMPVPRTGGGHYSACIGRPFTGTIGECLNALGPVAFAQSRLDIAVGCMTDGKVTTEATGTCQRFITSVGSNCANNPFDSSCADIFTEQVRSSGFAELAQASRLTHCTDTGNEASGLCTGALTYCAPVLPDSPNPICGTLVTDYCLGATGRMVTGRDDACTAVLAETCDENPFDSRPRCEADYEQARLEFCKGDGTLTNTPTGVDYVGITLADCKTVGAKTGQDLAICGNGTSGSVGANTNPFALVCQNSDYNDYHGMLDNAKVAYCGSRTALFLNTSDECEPLVMEACGTGGFNYSANAFNNAFNPLCRQETYDDARLAACDANPNAGDVQGSYYAGGCTTFRLTECPENADGLIGCAQNKNSTPIGVWTDNDGNALGKDGVTALEIVPEGGIRYTRTDKNTGAFAQAGPTGLDLSGLESVITRDEHGNIIPNDSTIQAITKGKIIKFDESDEARGGVDFAILLDVNGHTRYFTGLLRDTNVGGPLVNQDANGDWTGKTRLAISRNQAFNEITGFTLKVTFTGGGGTITTHTSTDDDAIDGDISVTSINTTTLPNRWLRINGKFNAEGVLYGTTDLYSTAVTNVTATYTKSRVEGTLTGLIGKTGAIGSFFATGGRGIIGQYLGGFVATPTSAIATKIAESTTDCSFNGAKGMFDSDLLTTLFHADCDYATLPRAQLCSSRNSGFDNRILNICREDKIRKLVCIGTGLYANPFSSLICGGYANLEASKLTFANQCDAGTATGNCSNPILMNCLDNPYSGACNVDDAYTDIRTNLESFCGMAGSGDDIGCMDAVRACTAANQKNCGNIVQTYCFAEAGRLVSGAGNEKLCTNHINSVCSNVNPFSDRCTDSVADVYDTTRRDFCSSQSLDELTTLGADLTTDCRPHAVAICGFYIPYQALAGPKLSNGRGGFTATGADIQEGRVYGTNPYADICTNSDANPDDVDRDIGESNNLYDRARKGAATHAKQVLAYYVREFCPVIPSNNERIDSCPKIDVAGADGYEAWQVAVGERLVATGEELISAGDAASTTEATNFIAGYGGGLYLGVGNRNVRNSKTFRLNAGANGFAYAATGTGTDTQLFTGLLSGTTNLGAPLGAGIVGAKWRSTLSFLTLQNGVITAIEKEGFSLTFTFAGGNGTIAGTENVGDGMVFQVAGTFTGTDNLLSGTVTFGATESGTLDSDAFAAGGLRTTGILSGVIGADGAIGVFKSDTGGGFGDFVGGFIAAPATDATDTVWALSFGEGEGNYRTDSSAIGVKLHSSGVNLANTNIIADGARSFIRLNAGNEIFVNNGEFTLFNPGTGQYDFGSESALNALAHGRDANGDGLAVESDKTIRLSLAFFNNSGLETPDNGASGVSFGDFKRAGVGNVWLAGLWPTTNMGLPLKADPTTAIWQGKISALFAGVYTGERDARFVIDYTGPGGTIKTITKTQEEKDAGDIIEGIFLHRTGTNYHYLNIDAKFDQFGAVSGTTGIEVIQIIRGRDDRDVDDPGATGRVSGLIGEKGLIGAFVSTASVPKTAPDSGPTNPGLTYLGGFYALNPDAPRSEEAGAPTSFGTWENSILIGGSSYDEDQAIAFPGLAGLTVNNFGGGAEVGTAGFARLGISDYIAADETDNSQALSFSFDENSGVGFGRVGTEYYSGLLAGADVGLSLTKNQEITTAATWSGKIALYGFGTGPKNATFRPSEEEMDFDLDVTFNGTTGTIAASSVMFEGVKYQFSGPQTLQYTLTINGTFNAAGVIKGTTSFDTNRAGSVASAGVVTGLIGTRGAIGSFISTKVSGMPSRDIYAGIYAGGFVVQNPNYELTPEIPVLESGDLGAEVNFATWTGSFAGGKPNSDHGPLQATGGVLARDGDGELGPYFIRGGTGGITTLQGGTNLQLSVRKKDGTFDTSTTDGLSYGRGYEADSFAGLWSGVNVGKAFASPPTAVVWEGKIGFLISTTANVAVPKFYLNVTFEGSGGTVRSSNEKGDAAADVVFDGNRTVRFSGDFTAAGVMTGTVTTSANFGRGGDGVFTGIIGEKGALGVFKSDRTDLYRYVGGFTATNPDYLKVGVSNDYNLWRVSFNSRGVNRQVTHPIITDTKLANPLHPRGVNVNQFQTGTTHFVQGELNGLNLTGSNVVTGSSFTPTLLKLADGVSGFALWQDDINVAGAATSNIQGYVGLLNGTDVGADPLVTGLTTYTGKIIAYVGDRLSDETDFTLNIDYGRNEIDAVVELLETRFQFDGRFNVLGVISGDVLIGADGVPGSFNGLLGTESAIGVFKNTVGSTVGNTSKTFIGGFVVSDKFANSPDWAKSFASGGANAGQALLEENGHLRSTVAGAGTHFIRATASNIRGASSGSVNLLHLHLAGSNSDGGVAFVQELSNGHQVGYAGLLSTTNVGLPLELPTGDEEISATWNGAIQAYVGETLAKSTFNLMVNFMDRDVDGAVTLGGKKFTFDGDFTDKGIMSGVVSVADVSDQGSFNGLIGVRGAAGVFKNNDTNSQGQFVGGFVVTPVLATDARVIFDAWAPTVTGLQAEGYANTRRENRISYFIRGSASGIAGTTESDILTLQSDLASGGVAFGKREDPNFVHNSYFTGLLKGTNVGRHIENENLNGVWKGTIRTYIDQNLQGAATFNLNVDFGGTRTGGAADSVGTLIGAITGFQFNGDFNRAGVISGGVVYTPSDSGRTATNGTFNGLIGTLGAVGAFKDDGRGSSTFAGGFVANPPTEETQ